MNREEKAAAVAEIAGQMQESEAVLAVDYRGISVAGAAELRSKLRASDSTFRVVKNTLTERAADQADAQGLKALLEGPTALTFVRGDVAAAAKAIADVQRASNGELLPFKGGILNGETLDPAQITAISRLPSRDVLHAQLVMMVAQPLTGLARTLNQLIAGVAVALGQVREKAESGEITLGGGAGTPAAAPAAEEPTFEAASATSDDSTDQDAEAPEPAVSAEAPAEGPDTTDTTEDSE